MYIKIAQHILSLFIAVLLLLSGKSLAQAPVITYSTPQVFVLGVTINPMLPANSGGPVPANIYNMVSTFAGGRGSVSIDGVAANAGFDNPSGIGTDASGNIYVSDFNSGAVRKITPAAVVTTIANISTPSGVAVDNAGNVFVSSFDECRIYKINQLGVKSIFAGAGYSGATDGTGTAASFYGPGGMNFDGSGNLYVADQSNNKIRKITPSGIVTTVAGNGSSGSNDGPALIAGFYNPDGVAVDGSGNVYIADSKNNKIRKISPAGIVSTLAGSGFAGNADGTGVLASFNYPTNIDISASGDLYVSDYRNNKIRKISPQGVVTTLAGSGNAGRQDGIGAAASFYGPLGLAFDLNDNLYVPDFGSDLIRKITLTGYTIDRTLPSGLIFDPTTGVISGRPTAASAASNYTITAYNVYGSSSVVVNISVAAPTPVTFPPIALKNICDGDFDPGVLSNIPITYTSSNPFVATVVAGKLHITGVGTSTITASNGITSASQLLTVNSLLAPSVVITPASIGACEGMELTYEALTNDAGNNPSYQWQLNGQDIGTNSPKFISSNLTTGDIITCVVTNNDGCMPVSSPVSNKASLETTAYTTVSVSITSSAAGAVCAGTPITFTAIPSDNIQTGVSYQWYVNGHSAGTDDRVFTSPLLADGDVVYCRMLSGGECVSNPSASSNLINVRVTSGAGCEIKVPNAFSPNGDHVNDTWAINAMGAYPDCSVKVFNRLGSIVYQSAGYREPWDGTRDGKKLPSGTYYYLIVFEGGKQKLSGAVTVLY